MRFFFPLLMCVTATFARPGRQPYFADDLMAGAVGWELQNCAWSPSEGVGCHPTMNADSCDTASVGRSFDASGFVLFVYDYSTLIESLGAHLWFGSGTRTQGCSLPLRVDSSQQYLYTNYRHFTVHDYGPPSGERATVRMAPLCRPWQKTCTDYRLVNMVALPLRAEDRIAPAVLAQHRVTGVPPSIIQYDNIPIDGNTVLVYVAPHMNDSQYVSVHAIAIDSVWARPGLLGPGYARSATFGQRTSSREVSIGLQFLPDSASAPALGDSEIYVFSLDLDTATLSSGVRARSTIAGKAPPARIVDLLGRSTRSLPQLPGLRLCVDVTGRAHLRMEYRRSATARAVPGY